MADSVAFALPTLPTGSMSRDDQQALIVNQATAAIISAWLEHATALSEAGITGNTGQFTVTSAELVSLINDVQGALRTV
jgi:hypothetical protein